MRRHTLIVASAAVIGAMLAAGILAALTLPAGASVPTHWNTAGGVDGHMRKWTGLTLLPLVTLGVAALMAALPSIEPMRDNLARSRPLWVRLWVSVLAVLALMQAGLIAAAIGWHPPMTSLGLIAVGLLLIVVGDYLPKSRRMFLVGIRTPWTLADEDIWIATHRLGGKLMVAAGVALCAVGFARPGPAVVLDAIIGTAVVVTIVPAAYSYVLWRRTVGARR